MNTYEVHLKSGEVIINADKFCVSMNRARILKMFPHDLGVVEHPETVLGDPEYFFAMVFLNSRAWFRAELLFSGRFMRGFEVSPFFGFGFDFAGEMDRRFACLQSCVTVKFKTQAGQLVATVSLAEIDTITQGGLTVLAGGACIKSMLHSGRLWTARGMVQGARLPQSGLLAVYGNGTLILPDNVPADDAGWKKLQDDLKNYTDGIRKIWLRGGGNMPVPEWFHKWCEIRGIGIHVADRNIIRGLVRRIFFGGFGRELIRVGGKVWGNVGYAGRRPMVPIGCVDVVKDRLENGDTVIFQFPDSVADPIPTDFKDWCREHEITIEVRDPAEDDWNEIFGELLKFLEVCELGDWHKGDTDGGFWGDTEVVDEKGATAWQNMELRYSGDEVADKDGGAAG